MAKWGRLPSAPRSLELTASRRQPGRPLIWTTSFWTSRLYSSMVFRGMMSGAKCIAFFRPWSRLTATIWTREVRRRRPLGLPFSRQPSKTTGPSSSQRPIATATGSLPRSPPLQTLKHGLFIDPLAAFVDGIQPEYEARLLGRERPRLPGVRVHQPGAGPAQDLPPERVLGE